MSNSSAKFLLVPNVLSVNVGGSRITSSVGIDVDDVPLVELYVQWI